MLDKMTEQAPLMTGSVGGSLAKTAREKTWDECGIEEKVERLRRVMRDQQHMVHAAYRTASNANDLAHQHQHNGATGEVLAAVNRRNSGGESIGRSFDPLA